jgi:hypothetical protein
MPLLPELNPPIEHGSSRTSRWLQERWLSLAAAIAILEIIFYVLGELSTLALIVIAVAILGGYFGLRKTRFSPAMRIAARIAALSQGLVLFVLVLIPLVSAAAIVALVVIAIVGVAALLRR